MSIEGNKKEGFQLGGGVRNLRRVYVDIFATSEAERDDLSDSIHSALYEKTITIKDFSVGEYLSYAGVFNTSLSLPLESQGSLRFVDVDQKNLHLSEDLSDLNKFRSLVSGTYESFQDSV